MEEKGLVDRLMEKNRRKFRITDEAQDEYFSDNESRQLDLPMDS